MQTGSIHHTEITMRRLKSGLHPDSLHRLLDSQTLLLLIGASLSRAAAHCSISAKLMRVAQKNLSAGMFRQRSLLVNNPAELITAFTFSPSWLAEPGGKTSVLRSLHFQYNLRNLAFIRDLVTPPSCLYSDPGVASEQLAYLASSTIRELSSGHPQEGKLLAGQ